MTAALEIEAARAVLTLREILMRFDEGAKADLLLRECVPYIVEHRRDIAQARADQAAMTAHLHDEEAMRAYYAANPHDRPFEEQYGLPDAAAALDAIPRFRLLADNLPQGARVLDLACNDGILAAALLKARPDVHVDGVDLGKGCIERARARGLPGTFACRDLHDGDLVLDLHCEPTDVVLFEVIEHVADPQETLRAAEDYVKRQNVHEPVDALLPGRLWVSTPIGAMEKGELPGWDVVEPKGHVRAYTVDSFGAELQQVGAVQAVWGMPDGTMVGCVEVGT